MNNSGIVAVIGGSAAGITAALTVKKQYPEKNVYLIRKEQQVLIPCGIPYIFGTVGKPENNLIPDSLLENNGIQLVIDEVTSINREKKELSLANNDTLVYEKLILATGSLPIVPPIPGIEKKGIFPIYKDINHLRTIQTFLNSISKLTIIGGGFIGVEFAEECKKINNIDVTIVEKEPSCLLLAYDQEFCDEAHAILKEENIKVNTSKSVKKFTGGDTVTGIDLGDGTHIETDAVILGVGSRSNTKLAEQAGLSLGKTGGIHVDKSMATYDPSIFACGDCAEKISFFAGFPTPLKLASIANAEARIAGANLYELRRENIGTIGVWSTRIGNTAFASAGLTELLAQKFGYKYTVGTAEAVNRHPGGMPGARLLRVKLVFEKKTMRLLGGQIMGDTTAGELINAVSVCINNKMSAEDIAMLQVGTHPALTASPIGYQLVNAAEQALKTFHHDR